MVVLFITLLVFLGLVLILAIPVSLNYQASWKQELRGRVKLRWAFGLVRVERNFPALNAPATQTGKRGGAARSAPPSSGRSLVAAWRQPQFRRRLIRLVADLWHAFHKRGFRTTLRIGLDDPAATGQLWGIVGPIAGMFAARRGDCLVIEPVFHECRFDFDSSGNIRVTPLKVITILLSFFLSPVVWKTFRHKRSVE